MKSMKIGGKFMGNITLVTGGMRSGKSTYAEKSLENNKSVLYIATSIITDREMEERVRIHQDRRGYKYRTVEGHKEIKEKIKTSLEEATLFECIGTFVTNWMFDILKGREIESLDTEEITQMENKIIDEIEQIIEEMRQTTKDHVIITNEVGLALISEYKLGRVFTDILGRVNQNIASHADAVYMIISGLSLKVK